MESPRIDLVLPRLACPVCGAGLARRERTVRCGRGHTFDLARQGYLPLLRGGTRAGQGDTAAMVAAREAFLARGHYRPISAALAEAVAAGLLADPPGADRSAATSHAAPDAGTPGPGADQFRREPPTDEHPPLVADLAGGTGHHLAAVLDHLPHAVGLDLELSPYALRRAAGAHPRLAAVRADVWQPLPLLTGSCAVVLSIFGPRNAPEIARVLTAGTGRLVVVTPYQDHLREIIEPLGMLSVAPDKTARLARQLAGFAVVGERSVRYQTAMTRADVRNEAHMGPSAHHVERAELERAVARLPEVMEVTVAVTVATYTPPGDTPPRSSA